MVYDNINVSTNFVNPGPDYGIKPAHWGEFSIHVPLDHPRRDELLAGFAEVLGSHELNGAAWEVHESIRRKQAWIDPTVVDIYTND